MEFAGWLIDLAIASQTKGSSGFQCFFLSTKLFALDNHALSSFLSPLYKTRGDQEET